MIACDDVIISPTKCLYHIFHLQQQVSMEKNRHVILVGEHNFYRQYDVAVQVFNSMGAGPVSNTVRIRSAMSCK